MIKDVNQEIFCYKCWSKVNIQSPHTMILINYFNAFSVDHFPGLDTRNQATTAVTTLASSITRCCAAGHWCGEDNHLSEFLEHVDFLFAPRPGPLGRLPLGGPSWVKGYFWQIRGGTSTLSNQTKTSKISKLTCLWSRCWTYLTNKKKNMFSTLAALRWMFLKLSTFVQHFVLILIDPSQLCGETQLLAFCGAKIWKWVGLSGTNGIQDLVRAVS